MKTREREHEARPAWAEEGTSGALVAGGPAASASGAVQSPPLDADAEPRATLGRYVKWQVKDFVRERGLGYLALGLVGVLIFRDNYHPRFIAPESEPLVFRRDLAQVMTALTFLGSLISTFGIVARDRERGFQRFLFAKPLRPTRYYLQSLAVNALGFLGVTAAILLTTSVAFGRGVPLLAELAFASGMFAAVGGLTFLLSTLVRFDVGLGALLSLASLPVAAFAKRWDSSPLWSVAALLLPPLPALSAAFDAVRYGSPVLPTIVGPLAYGAACVVAGLAILRRRSIAS